MLKSGRCLVAFLFIFSLIITFSNPADAKEKILFEKVLTVSNWHVHVSQHSFNAADAQDARIKISKVTPDKEIQRGFFVLNGTFTILRDFLVGEELSFEKDVVLRATNTMYVFLLGSPNAKVSMQILQDEAPAPKIKNFTADPTAIKRGKSATLTWNTDFADSCVIEPGVGAVAPSGSVTVKPTVTTTYTLTAEGTGGTGTDTVTVTIENSAPKAGPKAVTIDEDTAVAITLTATDVDSDNLTYAVSDKPGKGKLSGTPPALNYTPNKNYHLQPDGQRSTGAAGRRQFFFHT